MPQIIQELNQLLNTNLPVLKVGIYLRVSTGKQDDGYSKDIQLSAANEYIETFFKDKEICKIIYDDTMSASIPPRQNELIDDFPSEYNFEVMLYRPELKKLLNDVKHHNIDVVLVYCHDRLSRNSSEEHIIESTLSMYNIPLHYTRAIEQNSENNELLNTLFSWLSVNEALTLSSRAFNGGKTATESGTWTGGPAPFGYSLEDIPRHESKKRRSRLKINESEADIVVEIFDSYIEGKLPEQIALEISTTHIGKSLTNRIWSANSILDILKNPTYTGYQTYNKRGGKKNSKRHNSSVFIKSSFNEKICIIPKNKWEIVNTIIKSSKDISTHFLFKDIVRCNYCGSILKAYNNGKNASYYKCENKCQNHNSIKESKLHAKIFKYLEDLYNKFSNENNNNINILYDYYVSTFENRISEINKKINITKNDILEIKSLISLHDFRINSIVSEISNGKFTSDIKLQKQFLITSIYESKSAYIKLLEKNTSTLLYLENLGDIAIKDIGEFRNLLTSFFCNISSILDNSENTDTRVLNRSLRLLFKNTIDLINVDLDSSSIVNINFK